MDGKVTVLGPEKEKKQINKLVSLCTDKFSELKLSNTCVLSDIYFEYGDILQDCDCIVLPYELKDKININTKNVITFSMNKNNADFSTINFLEHDSYNSFEIMSTNSMGRVFTDKKCGYDAKTILICACIFAVNGAKLSDILEAVNSILKP